MTHLLSQSQSLRLQQFNYSLSMGPGRSQSAQMESRSLELSMNTKTIRNEGMALIGRSRLRAWKRGALREIMMATGDSRLSHAQRIATIEGEKVHDDTISNLVVTVGLRLAGDLLIDAESNGIRYHELGTSSTAPVSGNTDLGTSVARRIWTSRVRVSNVLNFSVFYTAAQSTYAIEECGAWGGDDATATRGSGTLFSHYPQSFDNSQGLVDLTFDYDLTPGT